MAFTRLTLPNRPLLISSGVLTLPRGFGFAVFAFVVLLGFMLWFQGPDLYRDWQISHDPVELEDAKIADGRCTTRQAVLTDCSADVSFVYEGALYESHVNLVFVDFHSGDYEAGVVISRGNPSLATLTLGIEKLWNRIFVLGGIVAVLAGMIWVMVTQRLTIARAGRVMAQPARLALVPAIVTAIETRKGKTLINYFEMLDGGKKGKALHSTYPAGEYPLIIRGETGVPIGIAVRHPDSSAAVLLDTGLQRLSLTDAERNAALAELDTEVLADGVAVPQKPKRQFLRTVVVFFAVMLVVLIMAIAYWVYYVTSSSDQYEQIGMQINAIMPGPVNQWGCDQMKLRFGDGPAQYGCTTSDYQSWK